MRMVRNVQEGIAQRQKKKKKEPSPTGTSRWSTGLELKDGEDLKSRMEERASIKSKWHKRKHSDESSQIPNEKAELSSLTSTNSVCQHLAWCP